MLQTLKLLLPALIPSWAFFEGVAPSPRIEYALLNDGTWREFRPRPEKLSLWVMLGRMAWNARWNESLFLVSCAERLTFHPTQHSKDEIFKRLSQELGATSFKFRLVFVSREGSKLETHITYESPIMRGEP